MSQIAALLIPAALPNSASAMAAARNAAVSSETFEATFAQFLTMLPALDAEQVAPTAPSADSAKLLSVFGIAPQAPATTQTDAMPGILSVPPLPDAVAPPDLAVQGLALVGQVAAQFASPPVTDPAQAVQTATTEPKTHKAASPSLTPPLRGSLTGIDNQSDRPKAQPEAKTAPATATATPPAAPLALPREYTPQAPAVAKPQAPSKPAPAAKGAPATKSNGPETNSVAPDGKPVSQRQSETAPTQTAATQTVAPVAQPQSHVADSTPQAPLMATSSAAAVLPAVVQVQELSSAVIATPQAGVPFEALAVHIARKFESGSNQFEIRLHPAELGQLDISLTVADNGHVQAVLRAERAETLDMLQKDARALEQQLRQAGLEVGSNALSFSLSSGNGQRHAPFTGWPGFADAQGVAGAAKEEAAAKYIAVRVRDGVDIRV